MTHPVQKKETGKSIKEKNERRTQGKALGKEKRRIKNKDGTKKKKKGREIIKKKDGREMFVKIKELDLSANKTF